MRTAPPVRLMKRGLVLALGLGLGVSTTWAKVEPQRCTQPDQEAVPLVVVQPTYPPAAATLCVEGYVLVGGTVRVDGKVTGVEVLESHPPHVFDDAAAAVVERWLFRTECRDGRPVDRAFTQRIDFQLQEHDPGCPDQLEGEALRFYMHIAELQTDIVLQGRVERAPYAPFQLLPETPRFDGDWGVLERHMLRSINRGLELNNQYFAKVLALGWDRFGDPARLAADVEFSDSRHMLEAMHELGDEMNRLAPEFRQERRLAAARLDVAPDIRALFLGTDEPADGEPPPEYMPPFYWHMLAESEAMLELLEETRGTWTVVNDDFQFDDQRHAEQLQSHRQALNKTVDDQRQMNLELVDQLWWMLNR